MSNDLQPTKSGQKTGYHPGINGQISQIPGLSTLMESVCDEKVRGRRSGILDSDTAYIKLAKQGGHKGLLWHEERCTSEPSSHKPPDCFFTASEDDSNPSSAINSEVKKNPGAFQRREPPFATDNMSAWERDDSSKAEEKDNFSDSQTENMQFSCLHSKTSNFRRTIFDKKPSPVNMSKLLSFGYAEDKSLDFGVKQEDCQHEGR